MNIGSRITELRKAKKWSQTELGDKAGVSREIIGRYERNDAMPSIEVAKKIADAFNVSLDYLAGDNINAQFNKETIKRMQGIEELEDKDREHLFFLIDNVIQNYKTKKAFG